MEETRKFHLYQNPYQVLVSSTLLDVCEVLKEKGYNPVNQIVGYLVSGDPAFIPRDKQAREKIQELDRHECLEELVKAYLDF